MAKREGKTAPLILFTAEDRAFLADLKRSSLARVKRVTKTKESALQELSDAGLYIRTGKLRKQLKSVA
ncbi:MAG: hypothetical protein P4K80_06875 [Acidobacteriaceae bacterium]|nr:hypothetical protein [Acidobacteriaceae bacterium]